ncbi:hypothetical protein AAMO2058_001163400 [Amorphochlora amoebiformis]
MEVRTLFLAVTVGAIKLTHPIAMEGSEWVTSRGELADHSPTAHADKSFDTWVSFCSGEEKKKFSQTNTTAFIQDPKQRSIALLLTGISHENHLEHYPGVYFQVDFRASLCNYKYRLLDYLRNSGFVDVDIFVSTNESPVRDEVIDIYKVKPGNAYFERRPNTFMDGGEILNLEKNKLLKGIELILHSSKTYDQVMITRFDLEFMVPFDEVTVAWDRINLVSMVGVRMVDDNFYLLPYKLLDSFYKMYSRFNDRGSRGKAHNILERLRKISPLNFLLDEGVAVSFLSFFKIVRRCETYDGHNIKVDGTTMSMDYGFHCRRHGAFLDSPSFCKCKCIRELNSDDH